MLSSFGKKIEIAQAEIGMSVTELAKKTGKSRQNIYILKKSKKPRAKTIHVFAKALGKPVTYFFESDDM